MSKIMLRQQYSQIPDANDLCQPSLLSIQTLLQSVHSRRYPMVRDLAEAGSTMNFAVRNALAVYWMLTCIASAVTGSPQGPYRAPQRIGTGINHPEIGKKSPVQFYRGDGYHGAFDSSYESIDQFQIEQQQQQGNDEPNRPRHGSYDRGDNRYYNRFRNEQESYYRTLLRVTESPLDEVKENKATYVTARERQTYYQDYLPLDDEEETFKLEDFNLDDRETPAAPTLDASTRNVENSTEEKFAKLVSELLMKDPNHVPSLTDLNTLDSLEDQMIAEASVPEEIRRRVRQVRGPGFLWTLARLAFEKVNDTKSAANQIGTIVNNNLSPDLRLVPIVTTTTVSSAFNDVSATLPDPSVTDAGSDSTSTTSTTTTTTEAPFRLNRTELQGIIRRNVKGLVRLFRIEWRDALNESQVSVRQFHRDLGNQIRPYLEPNPNLN